ncbi:hypothetical protein Back2_17570 [Nocardioides baekrokdamisoli]|uniref:HNH nuclease domain-containing protein n=2 Tax=Nocardioides baekrokdamisoli TaxID=1804624 RepID=A0A3G9IEQ5_9ACTN|nr:hypothetical protein Back2_17570 [Nocardioides baekrokdamisoli]
MLERPATRGTSNSNQRGSSYSRRRRREWLVENYRADEDAVYYVAGPYGPEREVRPACRCYRCGDLLTVDDVTVDRIIPGCQGGTYRRNNIRPACMACNSETGGSTRSKAKR